MRNTVRKRWFVVFVVVATLPALAAARVVAYPAFLGAPDHAHIVVSRIDRPDASPIIVFDQHVGDVAGPIYAQLVAGGRIPPGAIMHCPNIPLAPYYHYALTFAHAGIQTAVAASDAVGCRTILITYFGGGQAVFSWYAANGVSFWETLHQLVGAPLPI